MKLVSRLLTLFLFTLFVVSCNTTSVNEPTEVPLLTDADIDAAVMLDMTSGQIEQAGLTQGGATRLDLSSGSAPSALGAALDGLRANKLPESSGLEPLDIAFDETGYLAYVQTESKGGKDMYSIRIRTTRQGKEGYPNRSLIYFGTRKVDSVAVSQDGRFISFIVQDKNGNSEFTPTTVAAACSAKSSSRN